MDNEWWIVVVVVVVLVILIIILLVVLSVNRQPQTFEETTNNKFFNVSNIHVETNGNNTIQPKRGSQGQMPKVTPKRVGSVRHGRPPRDTSLKVAPVNSPQNSHTFQQHASVAAPSRQISQGAIYLPREPVMYNSMDNSLDGGLSGDLFERRNKNVHVLQQRNSEIIANSPFEPLPFEGQRGNIRYGVVGGRKDNINSAMEPLPFEGRNGSNNMDFNVLTQGTYGGYGNNLDVQGGETFSSQGYNYAGVLDPVSGDTQNGSMFREFVTNDLPPITSVEGAALLSVDIRDHIDPSTQLSNVSSPLFPGRRELTSIPIGSSTVLTAAPIQSDDVVSPNLLNSPKPEAIEEVHTDTEYTNVDTNSEEDKKVADVIAYSNALIYLFKNGDIIREDNSRIYVTSNRKIEHLEVFGGYIYGLQEQQLYKLDGDTFTTNEWRWKSDDSIDTILEGSARTNVVHVSSTFDGTYLWVQTSLMGFLIMVDGNEYKLVSKEVYPRHLRRYYASDTDHYTEVDITKRKVIAHPSGKSRDGVIAGVMDHTHKLFTISNEDGKRWSAIRIVRWVPYYIDR